MQKFNPTRLSVENAAELVAARVLLSETQEKRAAFDMGEIGNTISKYTGAAGKYIGENPGLQSALIGGGLGLGTGLLSGAMSKDKEKNWGRRAMLGAGIGAGLGYGAHAAAPLLDSFDTPERRLRADIAKAKQRTPKAANPFETMQRGGGQPDDVGPPHPSGPTATTAPRDTPRPDATVIDWIRNKINGPQKDTSPLIPMGPGESGPPMSTNMAERTLGLRDLRYDTQRSGTEILEDSALPAAVTAGAGLGGGTVGAGVDWLNKQRPLNAQTAVRGLSPADLSKLPTDLQGEAKKMQSEIIHGQQPKSTVKQLWQDTSSSKPRTAHPQARIRNEVNRAAQDINKRVGNHKWKTRGAIGGVLFSALAQLLPPEKLRELLNSK